MPFLRGRETFPQTISEATIEGSNVDGDTRFVPPNDNMYNILLGVTGSVAAIKVPEIICQLIDTFGAQAIIKVVLTQGGKSFWEKASTYDGIHWLEIQTYISHEQDKAEVDATKPQVQVYESTDEWKMWEKIGDPVEHIALRDWADICIIAPLSAHTLAKFAHGLCDDTLSCIIRAWDFGHYRQNDTTNNDTDEAIRIGKPLLLVPAMNTAMWEHPLTGKHLDEIQSFGPSCIRIIPPQVKVLACGEIGVGAMAAVNDIIKEIDAILRKKE